MLMSFENLSRGPRPVALYDLIRLVKFPLFGLLLYQHAVSFAKILLLKGSVMDSTFQKAVRTF